MRVLTVNGPLTYYRDRQNRDYSVLKLTIEDGRGAKRDQITKFPNNHITGDIDCSYLAAILKQFFAIFVR